MSEPVDHDSLEKGSSAAASPARNEPADSAAEDSAMRRWLRRLSSLMLALNMEERGIRRVLPDERHDTKQLGYTQIGMLWFSINLAANNVTLAMLGPTVFSLPFLDASLCAVFGMLVGCLPVCYIATYGPASGCRALVFARYTMGWWPAKLIVVLNIIVFLGYSLIDAVVAGQILSAVSPGGSLSVVVGIIVVSLIAWALTTFGYRLVHAYERYAWLPQLVVLSILAGVAGPRFDLSTATALDPATLAGNRLSFFSLCLAAAITYAGGAADYFVYYPASTPRAAVFAATLAGLAASFTFAFVLGVGLGTGAAAYAPWQAALATSQGALLVAGFAPLGAFGRACAVVVALGLVANLVPPTYSAGVDFQILGRPLARVPRPVWNALGVVVYAVCALAGRDHLAQIFTNFLALMGYWVVVWIAIAVEEDLVFRRGFLYGRHRALGWDWSAWDARDRLPVGLAALAAFLVGWAGAIVSMDQVWFVGPVARLVGQDGADMGNYVGFAWAALVYPPLRWLEIRRFGR